MPKTSTERGREFRQRKKSGEQIPRCSFPGCDHMLITEVSKSRVCHMSDGLKLAGVCYKCFPKTKEGREHNAEKVKKCQRRKAIANEKSSQSFSR